MNRLFNRKLLLIAVALLLIMPAVAWWVLLQQGIVGTPGDPVKPPFNLSDRISTIEVRRTDDGGLVARFDGWEEGDVELTGDDFLRDVFQRGRELPGIYKFLDVTSLTGVLWVVFGFAGQAVFMGRMLAQWYASEKARSSVVPPIFWWLSLLGSSMLMIYFIWRKEVVGFLGQSTGWIIYIRNLWFIYGKPKP